MQERVIRVANFDPKVKTYWFFQGIGLHLVLMTALIGFVTLPAWLVGGLWLVGRRFQSTSAVLTRRSIQLKTGFLVRVEKTIPLEQIQDLSMHSGPLLRAFGLASVRVETAGNAATANGADMTLAGLMDAEAFRDAVLEARDELLDQRRSPTAALPAPVDESVALLRDIRDSLQRLEHRLGRE